MIRTSTSMATLTMAAVMVPPLVASLVSAADGTPRGAQVGGFLFGGYLGGATWLAWFIIAFLLATWVYRDARSRGTSGALWAIVVIILPILGIVIYLVIRPTAPAPPPGYAVPAGNASPPQGPPS